jgi:hypothetical protein
MNKPTADELETLETQTNIITANLKEISDDPMTDNELDALQEQTGTIVSNLKEIEDNSLTEDDRLALEEQTERNRREPEDDRGGRDGSGCSGRATGPNHREVQAD